MKEGIAQSEKIQQDSPGFSWVDRFFKKEVFKVFDQFTQGHLKIYLPDGTPRSFGNPNNPAASILVKHPRFFRKIALSGEIGLGESYTLGEWSTPNLPDVLAFFIKNLEGIPEMSGSSNKSLKTQILMLTDKLRHYTRKNTVGNSKKNIREHYDLSNDFYSLWLDKTWSYSSAWYEKNDEDLAEAQENKYRKLCEKLDLKPNMKILEIGCGWGGFAIHAAKNFGVHVTAITISDAQYEKACERVEEHNLGEQIEVKLCDYRDVTGSFNAIVSIEMLEAVGHEFLPRFFQKCHDLLTPDGRLGLQVIICPDDRYDQMRKSVDWIKKHIFPGGQLPSVSSMLNAASQTGNLYIQHLENFGLHYAKTLREWRMKFNNNRESVLQMGFDSAFCRKWNFYLAYCEAAFESRNINVSQLVLARPNNRGFALENNLIAE